MKTCVMCGHQAFVMIQNIGTACARCFAQCLEEIPREYPRPERLTDAFNLYCAMLQAGKTPAN